MNANGFVPPPWRSGCGRYELRPVGRVDYRLHADIVVDGAVVAHAIEWHAAKDAVDAMREQS